MKSLLCAVFIVMIGFKTTHSLANTCGGSMAGPTPPDYFAFRSGKAWLEVSRGVQILNRIGDINYEQGWFTLHYVQITSPHSPERDGLIEFKQIPLPTTFKDGPIDGRLSLPRYMTDPAPEGEGSFYWEGRPNSEHSYIWKDHEYFRVGDFTYRKVREVFIENEKVNASFGMVSLTRQFYAEDRGLVYAERSTRISGREGDKETWEAHFAEDDPSVAPLARRFLPEKPEDSTLLPHGFSYGMLRAEQSLGFKFNREQGAALGRAWTSQMIIQETSTPEEHLANIDQIIANNLNNEKDETRAAFEQLSRAFTAEQIIHLKRLGLVPR